MIGTDPIIRTAPMLVRLRRDEPDTAARFAAVIERIRRMAYRHDGNGDLLVNEVWNAYAQKDPTYAVWAVIAFDGTIIGHALAKIVDYDGKWVGWVKQVEMDTPSAKLLKEQFLDAVNRWIREVNLALEPRKIEVRDLMMSSPRMTDGWARHAGFEPYRMVYRRRVI